MNNSEGESPIHRSQSTHFTVGIYDLPYELLILNIFTFLSANELFNVLRTSRSFYAHIKDESIWKQLSSRYGINDLLAFPGRTFHSVYTELLHKYGPLLGLWASDHPYRGNILEFRLVTPAEGWAGIVGEVWRFSQRANTGREPTLPQYYSSIRFELDPRRGGDHASVFRPAQVVWELHAEHERWIENGITHTPSFHLLSPTNQATFLHDIPPNAANNAISLHPEFPASISEAWYDNTRALPRIVEEPSLVNDNTFLIHELRDAYFLYCAPTDTVKPSAISIYLPPDKVDPLHLHDPVMHCPDLRHIHQENVDFTHPIHNPRLSARYYPLRFPRISDELHLGPEDKNWKPESLEGLWLGAYGPHGTEVLFLEWDKEKEAVRAWKITGDVNVPRGVVSWEFELSARTNLGNLSPSDELGNLPSSSRIFLGSGTVSGRGYTPHQRDFVNTVIAVIGIDDIKIRWRELEHTSGYRRYKPRDLRSEVRVNSGVRWSSLSSP